MISPEQPIPSITIEPDAEAERGGVIPIINPFVCADMLHKWGADDASIAATTITMTNQSPFWPAYSDAMRIAPERSLHTNQDLDTGSVYLHLGSISRDLDGKIEEEKVALVSRWLLEGLSQRADAVRLGKRRINMEDFRDSAWPGFKIILRNCVYGVSIVGASCTAEALFGQDLSLYANLGIVAAGVVGGMGFLRHGLRKGRQRIAQDTSYVRTRGWGVEQRAYARADNYMRGGGELPVRGFLI